MKTFFLIVALTLLVAVQALKGEKKAAVRNYDQKCIRDTGVDKELVKKTREGDWTSEDAKLKSFSFCMLKKSGLMTDDGKFHKDVALAKTEPEKREMLGKAIDKCLGKTDVTKNAAKDVTKDAAKAVAKDSVKSATEIATKAAIKDVPKNASPVATPVANHVASPVANHVTAHATTHVATKESIKDTSKDEAAWNYSKCLYAEKPGLALF